VRALLKISVLPIGKTLAHGFFVLVFTSVTLGFIFSTHWFFLGGTFGYQVSGWLSRSLGAAGTGMMLFFASLTYLVAAFNTNFDFLKRKPRPVVVEGEEESQEAVPEPVLVNSVKENAVEPVTETPVVEKAEVNNVLELPLVIEEKQEEELVEDTKNLVEEETEKAETLVLNTDGVELTVEKQEEKEEMLPGEVDLVKEFGEYDPKLDLANYELPPLDLLENHINKDAEVNAEELNANKNRIVDTLKNYGIEIEKVKATIGPTVTLYEIIPKAGVRIAKIKNLEDDIALSLSALGIRIIAPIPGKGTIGIEVPNLSPQMVGMRGIIGSEKFQNTSMELPIALGKTIANETFIADLAKMPHLLMAGATGQGKSVGLNAVLVSLLYKKHPSQVKFVLVDPKKVELTLFNKIERHFLAKLPDSAEAIITDNKKVIHTLNSLCIEMDQRYELLKDAQVRTIREYNAKFIQRKLNPNNGHKYLPYIVLVVDEFADLIMTAGKEVETPIARLAQLARAIGIHLIIATQRPSVNIITGTIKANFPARIAFRVTAKIDSRTILDAGGAEQLIGRGDMLLSTGSDLIRLQCAFVDTPEVERICEFIGSQRAYPSAFNLPEYVDENEASGGGLDDGDRDALFEEAARIVVTHQQGSASLIQRKLKLGYNRAGRIIDQLEAAGIVGPFTGSKARDVLIKDILALEEYLKKSEGPGPENEG
jgi:DNA segregation ATPase FtsK/SpoIIIE, S-DNA-T family